ncbi:MAG: energy-coupling factor transporter transmembrane component T, partial [Peptococcaceae bacterium]|nr:energy-coupling factor transporter transmembrane component T [Peptococcaceae bacterium]
LVAPMGSGEVQGERTPKSVIPSVATGQPNLEPPHASIWRRLDVRTKVIVFSSMVVLACLFHNPVLNLILTAGIAMIAGWSGVRLKRVAGVLLPLVPVFVLVLGVNAISFTHGLSGSYYLALTLSGIKRGITFVLRILMMVLATAFLAVSTPVDEIVQLLHKLRFPPSIAFVITTAIRFVPALDRRRTQILEAQKARGAKLEVKGIISPIRAYIPIMVPLLIYSITVANSLAMAMLDRGFGFAKEVTQLGETAFAGRDYMLLGLTVIVLGGFIYAGLILRMGR